MVIQQHTSARWQAISWLWQSGCFSLLAFQSSGWLFLQDKNYRGIPLYTICSNISPLKSLSLSLFHSGRWCDKTSHFIWGCKNTDTILALTHSGYWVASFGVSMHSKCIHLQQGLWCSRLTRRGMKLLFATKTNDNWNKFHLLALTPNPDMFSLDSVHVQWRESFVVFVHCNGCDTAVSKRQGIVSSPLEADQW